MLASNYKSLKNIILSNRIFFISILITLSIYKDIVFLFISKWIESGTYAHGFFIVPISLYIFYTKGIVLKEFKQQISILGLVGIFICSLIIVLAKLSSVVIIQQIFLILLIHSIYISIYGFVNYKRNIFPLSYLFFCVPLGHFLINYMQTITANFSAFALPLSGINIYHEKWTIFTSRGKFEVAAACSGVRYLIATLALTTFFSYFNFQSLIKRILFVFFSLVVSVIANSLRAYLVILLAHLSHLKLAIGIDHLIYGWFFFGLIIFFILWFGCKMSDVKETVTINKSNITLISTHSKKYALLLISFILIPPLINNYLYDAKKNDLYKIELTSLNWRETNELPSITPSYKGADDILSKRYRNENDEIVDLYIALYSTIKQDHEMISDTNSNNTNYEWALKSKHKINHNSGLYLENEFTNQYENILLWNKYVVGNQTLISEIGVKISEAFNQILKKNIPSYTYIISTPENVNKEHSRQILNDFIIQSKISYKSDRVNEN